MQKPIVERCFLNIVITCVLCLPEMKCGGTRLQPAGVISSTNYPNNYNSVSECIWKIMVKPTNQITLNFTDFALEPDHSCTASLTVYDGLNITDPTLGTFCGTQVPGSIRSTGSNMLVIFQSRARMRGRGFRAYYDSGKFKVSLVFVI